MHLVIYGPEGSGKGTQARLLSEKYHLSIYTAGDLVRDKAVHDQGALGKLCRKALTEGKYLPDRQMCLLIEEKIKEEKYKTGFILDGFPRTLTQAGYLTNIFDKMSLKLDKVIYLKLDHKKAIARLVKRKRKLFGSSQILHDDPVRIKERLSAFRKMEKEILQCYKKQNLLLEVEADQTVKKVFNAIVDGLNLKYYFL